MSRSGYSDDIDDNWQMIRWRGMVTSATRGKRGQKMLTDLLAALDAMPDKALIANDLQNSDGDTCALGALGKVRGIDMSKLDPEEPEAVTAAFGVAAPLVQEISFMNDEWYEVVSPARRSAQRWVRMRAWIASQIITKEVAVV